MIQNCCVLRFCCRFAADRGQATLLRLRQKRCDAYSVLILLDAVGSLSGNVGLSGLACCAWACQACRVLRFCCRFAADRGQATLLRLRQKRCGAYSLLILLEAVGAHPGNVGLSGLAWCASAFQACRVLRFYCRFPPDPGRPRCYAFGRSGGAVGGSLLAI